MEEKTHRRWPAAIGGIVLGLTLAGGSAFAAGTGSGPFDYLDLRSPNGTIQRVTVGDDGKLAVSPQVTTPPTTTPPTTAPPTSTPPATNPVGLKVVAGTTAGSAVVSWNSAITGASYGRDGKDASGYGAWTSASGVSSPQSLSALVAGQTYNVTVKGTLNGAAVAQTVAYAVPGATTAPPTSTPPTTAPPTSTPPTSQPPTTTTPPVVGAGWKSSAFPTSGPNLGWISGSSGEFTANGQHGTWRGTREDVATTWVQDAAPDATLTAGKEYGDWNGSLVVSLPLVSSPSEWANCATGACDSRWTAELKKVQAAWDRVPRDGILFYSPAWEFNGSWFNHHVDPNNPAAMSNALKRFRAVQQAVSPNAKVILTANRDTSGLNVDWRKAIPGYNDAGDKATNVRKYIDALGVDYYNGWAVASHSVAEFEANAKKVDGFGAPLGIESHRQNAGTLGVPLGVPEWSGIQNGQGSTGDDASFPTAMHDFFKRNAGTGAGNVVLDVNFAVKQEENGKFFYGPNSLMPNASAAYAAAF